jgi:hypothetical protein
MAIWSVKSDSAKMTVYLLDLFREASGIRHSLAQIQVRQKNAVWDNRIFNTDKPARTVGMTLGYYF